LIRDGYKRVLEGLGASRRGCQPARDVLQLRADSPGAKNHARYGRWHQCPRLGDRGHREER